MRVLAYKKHSFCAVVHWTAAQRKDFICFQLHMCKVMFAKNMSPNSECSIHSGIIAPKFHVNCTTTLADDDVKNEITSCQDVILEITDFPGHISDSLYKTEKEHSGLEVWLSLEHRC